LKALNKLFSNQSETFSARPAGDAQAACQQPIISRLSCNHPTIGRVPCRHSNKLFIAISQRLSLPDLPEMLRQPASSQSYQVILATIQLQAMFLEGIKQII
jgi:hypothetical protein